MLQSGNGAQLPAEIIQGTVISSQIAPTAHGVYVTLRYGAQELAAEVGIGLRRASRERGRKGGCRSSAHPRDRSSHLREQPRGEDGGMSIRHEIVFAISVARSRACVCACLRAFVDPSRFGRGVDGEGMTRFERSARMGMEFFRFWVFEKCEFLISNRGLKEYWKYFWRVKDEGLKLKFVFICGN